MKYITLAAVLALLYACSPNPMFHTPGAVCANGVPADSWACSSAQTPAQAELHEHPVLHYETPTSPPAMTTAPYVAAFPKPKPTDNVLGVYGNGEPIVTIRYDGRIFVHGKEVRTDREYRAAIKAIMLGAMGCTNERQLNEAATPQEDSQ